MIELVDTLPDINVQPAEYKRLLGYPRELVLEGRARELAEAARAWYAKHGRPWVYARQAESLQVIDGAITIDGVAFTSKRLQKTLQQAEADSAILVAVSAGAEVEAEAQKLWREEKPDEYFFLEIFGSAVVEHLVTATGARLCAWAEGRKLAVLPHYSPGYPEWDISEQGRLLELICRTREHVFPCDDLQVLDSGMLRPKKSLLAVFGLTAKTESVRRLSDLVPCDNCSFTPCQYRRSPYVKIGEYARLEAAARGDDVVEEPVAAPTSSLNANARYAVNAKALKRWADERLTLEMKPDGTVDALFRYEGSTCTNMGRSIQFHYNVKLGPRAEGYPIREQRCAPAPGDTGHTYMCRYMNNAEHLMVAIEQEKPLIGQPLNDVLAWQRNSTGASCYCEPASRKHKWGLVLETIHYALVQEEKRRAEAVASASVEKQKIPQEITGP